jgi:hypothetical protein
VRGVDTVFTLEMLNQKGVRANHRTCAKRPRHYRMAADQVWVSMPGQPPFDSAALLSSGTPKKHPCCRAMPRAGCGTIEWRQTRFLVSMPG